MRRIPRTIFSFIFFIFLMAACVAAKAAPLATPTPTSLPSTTMTPPATASALPFATPQAPSLQPSFSLGTGELPHNIEYSPDGKFIFVHDNDAYLSWLDAKTRQKLVAFDLGVFDKGVIAYSHNNQLVALNVEGELRIYNMAKHELLFSTRDRNASRDKVQVSGGEIQDAVFSPDNHYLVLQSTQADSRGGDPDILEVWDVQKQQLLYFIPGLSLAGWKERSDDYGITLIPANAVNPDFSMSDSAISPNVKLLSVGDSKGNVFVWDLATGLSRYLFKGQVASITHVAFSPDGRFLASSSLDGTVRLWNLSNGKLERVITGMVDSVSSADFLPGGKQLQIQVTQQAPQIFDLSSGKWSDPLVTSTPDAYLAELLKQGRVPSGESIISPDSKTLILYKGWPLSFLARWDIATQTFLDSWEPPKGRYIRGVTYGAQGQLLAILGSNTEPGFAIFNTESNQQIFPSAGLQRQGNEPNYSETIFSFAHDQSLVAAANNNLIKIWNFAQGQPVASIQFEDSSPSVQRIQFSQDASQLYAVLDGFGAVQVFDVKSGQRIGEPIMPELDRYNSYPYYHSDLRWPWFARSVGADEIELWNMESKAVQKAQIPGGSVSSLCFSPDASLVYIQSGDQGYFWKTDSAQLVYRIKQSTYSCYNTFSADGKWMVVSYKAYQTGKISVWDVQPLTQLAHQAVMTPLVLPTLVEATETQTQPQTPSATPSPKPTLAVGSVPTQALAAGAIVPENAGQVHETARFGQGDVNQLLWPAGGQSLWAVGSQGISEYNPEALIRTGLQQPAASFSAVSQTADGRWVVGTNGPQVQLWDLSAKKLVLEVQGSEPAISPDGKLLAYLASVGYQQTKLHVVDVETGQSVGNFFSLGENDHPVFSPDGQLVAAVQYNSYDREYNWLTSESVRVWDAHTCQIVNAVGGLDVQILSISFSDDGKYIVGVAGGSAWVWPLDPKVAPATLTLDPGYDYSGYKLFDIRATAAALSPDSRILAVGSSQRTLSLYDRRSLKLLRQLPAQNSPAALLRFSPDGKNLLSVGRDGRLTRWDVSTGKILASQDEHSGPLVGMRFGSDGNLLAWDNTTLRTIRPQDASSLRTTSIESGTLFAASPDGLHLATYLPYTVSILNAQNGELEQTLDAQPDELPDWGYSNTRKDFTSATFSEDGSLLALAGTSGAWVYDMRGNLIDHVPVGYPYPQKLVLSPNAQQIAGCSHSQYEHLCTIRLQTISTSSGFYTASDVVNFAFNPAADQMGVISSNGRDPDEFTLWQVATGVSLKSLPIPNASLTRVAFSADGRLVAIGQADGKILLIETDSLKVLTTLTGHVNSVKYLAFSKTGEFLASAGADGTIRFWNVP